MSKREDLSNIARIGRSFLKRFMYSQLTAFSSIKIALGLEQPLIRFSIEGNPPSVYWVFQIRESMLEPLNERLKLPVDLPLCKIRCLEDDEARYLMALNAYRVTGLAKGLRAEWSVFVEEESGAARYMVVDARSSTRSVDPIDIITPASRVDHIQEGNRVHTLIGPEGAAFSSEFALEQSSARVNASPDWVAANDRIYWLNGVRDRIFYGSHLALYYQIRVDAHDAKLLDQSEWARYLEPVPLHILVLDKAVELILSPWENIDERKAKRRE